MSDISRTVPDLIAWVNTDRHTKEENETKINNVETRRVEYIIS